MIKHLVLSAVIFIFSPTCLFAVSGTLPGLGTQSDPYLIEDLDDFIVFADQTNSTAYWSQGVYTKLTGNLDFAGRTFTNSVIAADLIPDTGSIIFDGTPYQGHFDGNHCILYNLTITGKHIRGLFGQIGPDSTISNLNLYNITFNTDGLFVGGICAINTGGQITKCRTDGMITGSKYVGGLVGYNKGSGSTIENCDSSCTVGNSHCIEVGGLCGWNEGTITGSHTTRDTTGSDSSGGLCGHNTGTITDCYSTGSVSGNVFSGGLTGSNSGIITACYSTASVNGSFSAGGFCAQNSGTISQCYTACDLESSSTAGGFCGLNSGLIEDSHARVNLHQTSTSSPTGGFCGYNDNKGIILRSYTKGSIHDISTSTGGFCSTNEGHIIGSYWDMETFQINRSNGGTGLTTTQMQSESMYSDIGWGGSCWTIEDGMDYPRLIWEGSAGLVIPPYSGPVPATGSGTSEDPWIISSKDELLLIGSSLFFWDKHYQLSTNIDLSGQTFNASIIEYFSGSFDGNDRAIKHLSINGQSNLGLFGYVLNNAAIQKLTVLEADISGTGTSAGIICGRLDRSTIQNCHSSGSVRANECTRGLVGLTRDGMLNHCSSVASVTSQNKGGGLIGCNHYYSLINHCNFNGSVTLIHFGQDAGGVAGENWGSIQSSHSTGTITGNSNIGGLVGLNYGNAADCSSSGPVNGQDNVGGFVGQHVGGTITASYSTGSVTAAAAGGGFCGRLVDADITDCYSTGSVYVFGPGGGFCGYDYPYGEMQRCYAVGPVAGNYRFSGFGGDESTLALDCFWDIQATGISEGECATGLPTADMMTETTFTNAGWDFTNTDGTPAVWMMVHPGRDYPRLAWQPIYAGDIAGLYGVNNVDLLAFSQSWLSSAGQPNYNSACDLDSSGASADTIDQADLIILIENWMAGI